MPPRSSTALAGDDKEQCRVGIEVVGGRSNRALVGRIDHAKAAAVLPVLRDVAEHLCAQAAPAHANQEDFRQPVARTALGEKSAASPGQSAIAEGASSQPSRLLMASWTVSGARRAHEDGRVPAPNTAGNVRSELSQQSARPDRVVRRGRSTRALPGIINYMINVTEAAAEKITELLTEENRVGAGLRVFVQGGGCSGFQYGLMIDEGEGDPASDQTFEVNGVRLFVDPISLRYLKGAEVDFVDNSMGGGFTIKNPNAKSTCGCGSSFSRLGPPARADSVRDRVRRETPSRGRPPIRQARLHRQCVPAPAGTHQRRAPRRYDPRPGRRAISRATIYEPCSGWSMPGSRGASTLARAGSASNTPIAIRGTSI